MRYGTGNVFGKKRGVRAGRYQLSFCFSNENLIFIRTGTFVDDLSQNPHGRFASMGGKAAHAKGTAHQFTSEEARAAGRKGGAAVSRDRKHMAEIGRKGGANGTRPASQESGVTD